jgi:aryl-alcohol dehydrogenase-like predicted oxidoreductase
LAWVLAQGEDVVPIPGTKKMRYLEQNAGAASIQLTPADLKKIAEAAPQGVASGPRYPESAMQHVNR